MSIYSFKTFSCWLKTKMTDQPTEASFPIGMAHHETFKRFLGFGNLPGTVLFYDSVTHLFANTANSRVANKRT